MSRLSHCRRSRSTVRVAPRSQGHSSSAKCSGQAGVHSEAAMTRSALGRLTRRGARPAGYRDCD